MARATRRGPTKMRRHWPVKGVAVGTTITDRPPHRTVRARLRIRLPPRMSSVKALHRVRMESARDRNPFVHEPEEPVHGDAAPLTAAR